MEWQDHGIVLAERRHGESGAIVSLLTVEHGRHAGRVRSTQSARTRGVFVPGNLVLASWRARLDEHLGTFTAELVTPFAARVLDDPARLACLASACALTDLTLPEREPHPRAFAALQALMETAARPDWAAAYVRWELDLLAELGFGLDFRNCAVTGVTDDLGFVSPRTGRAVSVAASGPWRDRLLALPRFLVDPAAAPSPADLRAGLALTGHFLATTLFAPQGRAEPGARSRLLERIDRLDTMAGRGKPE
jgi:DNA repair protein RecO (recombination protein O)